MSMLEKLVDARNTVEGKALAVFLCVVLALSFINVSAFANEGESEYSGEAEMLAVSDAPAPAEDAAAPDPAPAEDAAAPSDPVPAPDPAPDADGPASGGEPASPEPDAPAGNAATVGAATEAGVVRVALSLEHGYLTYLSQDVKLPANYIDVASGKDLVFAAAADAGYELSAVKMAANGTEVELSAAADGTYTVPAASVADGLALTVQAAVVEGEVQTPAAEPLTGSTVIEPEDTGASTEGSPAFEGYAYADGVTVKVTAPAGALPEGTTVQAASAQSAAVVAAVSDAVAAQNKQLQNAVAIDVTLRDAQGNVIQPTEAVNVCFFDAGAEGGSVGVYHVADDASSAERVAVRQADADVQSFDVSHFSIYVVVVDTDVPVVEDGVRVEVKFVYPSGATAKDSYTEEVYAGSDGSLQFSCTVSVPSGYTAQLESSSASEFSLSAQNQLTATFADTDKKATKVATIAFNPNEVDYTVTHKYPKLAGVTDDFVTGEGQALDRTSDPDYTLITETKKGSFGSTTEAAPLLQAGFSQSEVHNAAIDSETGIKADIVYERTMHTVTYNTNGGSYVKAASVGYGASLDLPQGTEAPARQGYRFDGWYDNAELQGSALTSLQGVKADQTLYAKWAVEEVSYRVVFWTENADDTDFSSAGSVSAKAATGTETAGLVTQDSAYAQFETLMGDDGYGREVATYFAYKETVPTDSEVAADGTTVINVYYSRNSYTLRFVYGEYVNGTSGKWNIWTDTSEYSNETGGKTTVKTVTQKPMIPSVEITAKYGADISSEWPTPISEKYAGCTFCNWAVYKGSPWGKTGGSGDHAGRNIKGVYSTLSASLIIDPEDQGAVHELRAWWHSSPYTYSYDYYVEALPGQTPDAYHNGKGYVYYRNDITSASSDWDKQTVIPQPHLTCVAGPIKNFEGSPDVRHITYYYDREVYTITYVNGADTTTATAPYETVLTSYNKTLDPDACPLKYQGSTGTWTLEGWYLDDTLTQPVNWDQAISSNMTVYAKWKAPTYDLAFNENYEGAATTTKAVAEGETAATVAPTPEREGYTFGGWYVDPACTQEYDLNAPTVAVATVYAKWNRIERTSYTIKYLNGEGAPVAPEETGSGRVGDTVTAQAKVIDGLAVNAGSASIVLDVDPAKNVITFVYSVPSDYQYKVQYAYEEGGLAYVLYTDKASGDDEWFTTTDSFIRVYPTADAVSSDALRGYTLQNEYMTATMRTDKESNVITFLLDPVEYTLTYANVEGVSWGASGTTNPNPSTYSVNSADIAIANPSKDGYTFTGWTVAPTAPVGEYKEFNVTGAENPLAIVIGQGSSGNLTLVAQFKADFSQIEAEGFSKKYNGEKSSIALSGLIEGDTVAYYDGTEKIDNEFVDVTNKAITVVVTRGMETYTIKNVQAVITQRTVTLTSADGKKVYDGSALVNGTVTVGGDGFVAGEGATYNVTGSQLNVGDSKNTFTYTLDQGTKASNYTITTTEGTLKVTPAQIKITANDNSKVYNAPDPSPISTYRVTQGAVGTEKEAFTGALVRDPGESVDRYAINQGTVALADDAATGFEASNYELVFTQGTFEITASDALALTLAPYEGVYDAAAHGVEIMQASAPDQAVVALQYSVDSQNWQNDPISYTDVTGGAMTVYVKASASNYADVIKSSTVTVNPRPVTLTSGSATKVFDGQPLVNGEVAVGGMGFVAGEGAAFDVTGSQTEVGSSANAFSYVLSRGTDAGNYDITAVEGTLTITAAPVPVTPPPTVPPVTPVTPPTIPVPGPAGLPAGDPVAPVAEALQDAATPLAEAIGDEGTPLAGHDHAWCWVHYYIILGIILTAVYSLGVVARRLNYGRKIRKFEDDTLGKDGQQTGDQAAAGATAPRGAQPTMAEGMEA